MKRSWRPWIVLSFFSLLILLLGHSWGDRQGLLWAVSLTLGLNCLFYFYGELVLKPSFKGQIIEGQDPWNLRRTLKALCLKARIVEPQLILLPLPAAQAFAVGRNPQNSRIYLTEGLLKKLSTDEIEAVLAFELALIAKAHTLSMSLASTLLAGLLTITRSFDSVLCWLMGMKSANGRQSRAVLTLAAAPLAGFLLRLILRPEDFYQADHLACQWIKEPRSLAQTLWKLEALKMTEPWSPPPSTAHYFVINPLTSPSWTGYFQVQPPVEERVRRLIGSYPL
ncbi:MAG: M48 family metalloprotease [Bdellovibrionales bacterium]|nr:M48 family metalloprotease [Bdellovibrionales bacterium]